MTNLNCAKAVIPIQQNGKRRKYLMVKVRKHRKQRDNSIAITRKYYNLNGRPNLDYFENRSCPVCSSNASYLICKNDSWNTFVKCQDCQMVYMNPTLKKELINDLYLDSKNSTAKHKLWNEGLKELKPLQKPQNSERFDLLLKYSKRGRFLDFGCGFGKVTDQLKFYFDEIEGLEIDSFCAKYAEIIFGLKIYSDFIENHELIDMYDACMSYNNIEHLLNPGEVLKHLYASLKKKGIIYIECPNIESLSIKIFKGKHHLLQSNDHVNMFSLKTLYHLLRECGFEPIECRTRKFDILFNDLITFLVKKDDFYHRCSSSLLNVGIYKKTIDLVDKIMQRIFSLLNNRFCAQGSYIQVVARKS